MCAYQNVVGIDLGTTNTLVSYEKAGKFVLVKFPGGTMLPSVLYVDKDGTQYIGRMAKNKGKSDPRNMIRSSKTKMGKPREEATWICNGKSYTPTDVATEILKEARRAYIKQAKLPEDAEIGAVITVPAYFNSNQKDETKKAGEAAGFHVMKIITEPMAAAVAAITDMEIVDRKVLVVDVGGGTFDLCVLQADKNAHTYETIDVDGDRELGGDDFDKMLASRLLRLIMEDTGRDFTSHEKAGMEEGVYNEFLSQIQETAEDIKIELSDTTQSDLSIPDLFEDYSLDIKFSREEFNQCCQPLFDRIFQITRDFIQTNEKFSRDEIGDVILAGGSCYIPYIEQEITGIFGRPPRGELDKSRLVVQGAAMVAQWLNSGMESRTSEVLSHSLGVEVYRKNGQPEYFKLLDKATPYPTWRSHIFTTFSDNQESIVVKIYEAGTHKEKSVDLKDHDFYGSMVLEGIKVAPRGVPQIEVTFDYDQSGCLTVSAKDLATGACKTASMRKGEHVEDAASRVPPMDIMVLMDTSGSMGGRELMDAQKASHMLVNDLIDFSIHRVGLVSFNHAATLRSDLTADRDRLHREIDNFHATGGTDFANALQVARDNMKDPRRKKMVILVTDGEDGDTDKYLPLSNAMRSEGFRLVAIGVGSDADLDNLTRLANPGDFYTLANMSELQGAFEKIINGLAYVD